MPRKKKTDTSENIKITTKAKSKKVKDENVIVTDEDRRIVREEIEKNKPDLGVGEFGEKKRETSKKKHYTSDAMGWEVDRIVMNVEGKKYTKTYQTKVFIGKDKINKLVKYGINKWGKLNGYSEGDTDITFDLLPIE